jgi:cytochrome c-type biogenesis protein
MTLALAFLAGLLSVINPCVLPLIPIVLAGAASEHRLGPLALAGGLALSFTAIGLFVAVVGFAIGLDGEFFRGLAAVLFVALGAILLVPALSSRVAFAAGPVANRAEQTFAGFAPTGLGGQFAVGALLGAVWVPCSGPTIAAASVLASQGESLPTVAATMLVFGLGAALPLALLGLVSREAMLRWRARMMAAGRGLRMALGVILVVLGLAILSGLDRAAETALLDIAPLWLIELTTRY